MKKKWNGSSANERRLLDFCHKSTLINISLNEVLLSPKSLKTNNKTAKPEQQKIADKFERLLLDM